MKTLISNPLANLKKTLQKVAVATLCILFKFCLFASVLHAQTTEKITWDYPIKPDSIGWNQCNSPDEINEKLNIPENILKDLDTESLVQICLDYPALSVFFLTDAPQQGFDVFFSKFNGIRELMSREDVGHFLLQKYSRMSMADFNFLWSLEKQGDFVFRFYHAEIFLAQPQSIQSLDDSDRSLLLKESIRKYELKESRDDLFGGISRSTTTWVLAKSLHAENKLQVNLSDVPRIEHSLQSGDVSGFDVRYLIQQAKKYANE